MPHEHEPEAMRVFAEFDEAERHRYRLRCEWEGGRGCVLFVMLNPSMATPKKLDPTAKKVVGFAHRWGYAAVEFLNLYSLRTPYPEELWKAEDRVGPDCYEWFSRIAQDPSIELVVAAWGGDAEPARVQHAQLLLARAGHPRTVCLGYTKQGYPRHPVRLAYATPLERGPVWSE